MTDDDSAALRGILSEINVRLHYLFVLLLWMAAVVTVFIAFVLGLLMQWGPHIGKLLGV